MNDRFSAKLRQHLLETADEHPAYGQFETVMEGVDSTGQHHPLLVRLSWGLERFGLLPGVTVRYGLLVAALALAAGAGAILGGAGAVPQPSTVFEGTWITVDPADGSGMTLVVGPGTTPDVYFEDGYTSGRACVDDVVKRFTARGIGQVSGDRLDASFPDGGGCGLIIRVDMSSLYDHDPRDDGSGDDTLTDEDGHVWTRALGGQRETQVPGTAAPATQAPNTETPVDETPAAETPAPATETLETAAPETPLAETPAPEPPAETPAVEMPATETPLASPSAASTPNSPTPTTPPG